MNAEEHERFEELKAEKSHILASIRYAKRIQDALLITRDTLRGVFPDFCIVYEPKDIVSGDFYFAKKTDNIKHLVVGDCTGHGVPGGFMSILCNDYTSRALHHKQEPKEVLELIDHYLEDGLNQHEINDGMDASIAMMDYDTNKLSFAAANHFAVLFAANGSIEILHGSRRSIGKESWRQEKMPFDQVVCSFSPGDVFFMFTDGFRDQFNVEEKKIGKKAFLDLLSEIHLLPMFHQQQVLNTFFQNHKGAGLQTDDVLVLGVKL